ncbi:MAG: D-alanine-D-alanine ligase, D-alanine-D-alanine ligase [archaeon GW2011_AR3]|nr:MAG: D-alanine-D-alanine ligase, D-alanine-D-alanine ligase [archaeon GW2011_AR3]MBS3109951.1 ATP-grasp domain-containing protein [Candidatus Woesearchaeota archaeon]
MRVAVLSNVFEDNEFKEVEDDLVEVGRSVVTALKEYGHEVSFFDVNEKTFEKLRKANVDMAFNVCERFNGNSFFEPHVAAMLELLGIPYTGSAPLTLALCMNKVKVKEILNYYGIPTPKFQVFYSRNKKVSPDLTFPLIVKPVAMDNSIGITNDAIVNDEKELMRRVSYIIRTYNQPALVEEYIDGREFAVGVWGNNGTAQALPVSEIVFGELEPGMHRIFTYDAKWDKESEIFQKSVEICPVDLPKSLEVKLRKIALDTYKILGARDYGRIDFRLSADGTPYVLELNPNPGISADNTLPKAAKSLGITYNEMINRIFTIALDRYGIKHEIYNMTEIDANKLNSQLESPNPEAK